MPVRRRARLSFIVPVTSMGDIAMLLIIFFMVTSNFIKEAHVELTQPKSPDIERLKESQLSVSLDRDGELWLQGKPCPVDALESGIAALIEGRDDKVVMLKVDKDLPQEKFGPVMMALSKAGAEISLVGTKSEE